MLESVSQFPVVLVKERDATEKATEANDICKSAPKDICKSVSI